MRVLVTGDSGLIGSHLVDKLQQEKHRVFGVSRTARNIDFVSDNHINIDLRNRELTEAFLRQIKPDVVFHLAANVAEGKSQKFPIDITQNNISVFMNVLVPSIKFKVKRFVLFSSNAVYGEIPTPYKETDTPKPQDIYAINKLAEEEILKVLAKVYDFEYVILRPHNVYGERQYMNDRYKNVVMLFMNQILRKEPYKLFGGGLLKRNFSYVKDVVDVAYQCGFDERAKNEIFNVGSDIAISLKELSDTIQKVTGSALKPLEVEQRANDVHDAIPSHVKQNTLLSYNETPLYDGLLKTWQWAKMQGAQEYDEETPEL